MSSRHGEADPLSLLRRPGPPREGEGPQPVQRSVSGGGTRACSMGLILEEAGQQLSRGRPVSTGDLDARRAPVARLDEADVVGSEGLAFRHREGPGDDVRGFRSFGLSRLVGRGSRRSRRRRGSGPRRGRWCD